MSPPRKDPIPNQGSNIIINKQYPILPTLLENVLLYISLYLIIRIIQIKQKTTLMILQIINVMRLVII